MLFESTQNILEKTEAHILKLPSDNKLWGVFTRYIVFPLKYLWLGLGEFFKPASLWVFIAFTLMVLASSAINNFEITSEYSALILNFCLYFPMILVIFAVPSTYSYYGVKDSFVQKTVNFIEIEGINSIEQIELLEENIEKLLGRILSRVSFYKWLIGAIWAFYLVIINFQFSFLMKENNQSVEQALSDNSLSFILVFFSAIGALILVVGYKRASELLIKSIEFGCVEKKYQILGKRLEKAPLK